MREKVRADGTRDGGTRLTAVVVALALFACLFACGGCALKQAVDGAVVLKRGQDVARDIKAKATDGYDVRKARAAWGEAVAAFGKQDYEAAGRHLDDSSASLSSSERAGERVYYDSSGGLRVSGLVFRPETDEPRPLVVVNHAGFGDGADFSDVGLIVRDQGYVAFCPDFRGSGKSGGRHEMALGEVDDVIHGIEHVRKNFPVDGDRVGLFGQSHGATVALLAAARHPVKAVVAEAGVTDTALEYDYLSRATDAAAKQVFTEVSPMIGGTPSQIPDEYSRRSPVKVADRIRCPVLIVHGAKDPIVPVEQAEIMHQAIKGSGGTSELKIYPEEGHCVGSAPGRAEVFAMMFDLFRRCL